MDCKTTNQGACLEAFFSFKFKYGSLHYEPGNNICTGDLCWISGPFQPRDWNDLEVFWLALKLHLKENEQVETDDGYIGEDPCFTKCPSSVHFMEDWHWKNK